MGNCLHIASCAASRCLNSCSPFCHIGPTPLSETSVRSPMFFGTCGLISSRPRGRIEDCSFFQMMHGFPSDLSPPVLSSPGSMIVTFLSSTSPCQCWTRAPLLRMFALRCVERLKGPFWQHLAVVKHLMRAPILRFFCCLLNNLLFLNAGPLFVCFVSCNIFITLSTVGFLPVRWYPQLLVDILCASIPVLCTSSYISMFT